MSERKYGAPAAEAVLAMLEFMASDPGARGPTELAACLGITQNLSFRILNILTEKGYVKKNPAGQYELTAALFSLGMKLHNRFDLRTQARPWLEDLAVRTGESVQLQIPDGDRMLLLDFAAPPMPYYLVVTPGTRLYWHGNAFGKAVLAFLPEEEMDKILSLPRLKLSGHTITDEKKIRQELTEIRKTYSSSEFEEYLLGSYCIASPVFDAAGKITGAVGVTGIMSRLEKKKILELKRKIRACANHVSRSIGYKKEDLK